MTDYIWCQGPVTVSIEALICGPLAIHEKTDNLDLYTITHIASGFAMYGLLIAAGVDTGSLEAVTATAEKLMTEHPDLDWMLRRIHSEPKSQEADRVRNDLIGTLASVGGDSK